jgi:WD40 repeat protein
VNDPYRFQFSHDNKLLAIGMKNGIIEIWSCSTWNFIKDFNNHKDYIVRDIKFSINSDFLFSCADDETVKIYNLKTLELFQDLKVFNSDVMSLYLSGDDSLLYTA